tara:strand:+ start:2397 stop:3014 length:618 start_codon:yes stop_codon:yes gene_type:complete
MKLAPILLLGILFFYVFYNDYTVAAAFRYTFDMAFNIGMGEGNLKEDSTSLFVTAIWMLVGYFVVFKWWLTIVQTIMGNDSVLSSGHKKFKTLSKWFGCTPLTLSITTTLVWGTFGIIIGIVVEKWSFSKSLNFAVGGMTTSGSQLVSNTNVSNILGGIFILLGVPFLSITMSLALIQEDNKLFQTTQEYNKLEQMGKTDKEIKF